MTRDEIDRLIQGEPIATFRVKVNVDGAYDDTIRLTHDPTLRRHASRYDRADVTRCVRRVLHAYMTNALEVPTPPSTCGDDPYGTVMFGLLVRLLRRADELDGAA